MIIGLSLVNQLFETGDYLDLWNLICIALIVGAIVLPMSFCCFATEELVRQLWCRRFYEFAQSVKVDDDLKDIFWCSAIHAQLGSFVITIVLALWASLLVSFWYLTNWVYIVAVAVFIVFSSFMFLVIAIISVLAQTGLLYWELLAPPVVTLGELKGTFFHYGM